MATKEEIKDSAYYCFAHYGYEGTTMQDIAKAVGLKKQSLYSHFESKEELYLLVWQEQQKQILSELMASFDKLKSLPAEEMLQGLFKSCVAIFANRERLLLWKRAVIYYSSGDNTFDTATDVLSWHFEALKDTVYNALKGLYPALANNATFQSFLISYMLMIQGYLEWMMVKGYDISSWESVWTTFWNGAKNLFLM